MDSENDRMDDPDRIYHVKIETCHRPQVFVVEAVVITCIGVSQTFAAGWNPVEASFKERFQKSGQSSWDGHLLSVDELV